MTSQAHPAVNLIRWPRDAVVPFVLAAILAWAAAATGGGAVDQPRYLGAGAMILLAGLAGVVSTSHERWARLGVLPSAMCLVLAVALLRASVQRPWPGTTEVTMIPVLLAALHSRSPRHLTLVLAAVTVISAPWLSPDGSQPHPGFSLSGPLLLLAMSALTAFAIQRLINDARNSATAADEQACTDALTGLPNRRAWERELTRRSREDGRVTLAILDLDEFKQFNDVHGHPAGDRLLIQTAAAWRSTLRAGDVIARIGGEEFGLLLSGDDGPGARAMVERLRSAVPSGRTCSAGMATARPGEGLEAVIARADRALYLAKQRGRDRLLISDVT